MAIGFRTPFLDRDNILLLSVPWRDPPAAHPQPRADFGKKVGAVFRPPHPGASNGYDPFAVRDVHPVRDLLLKGDALGFGWGLWLVHWGGEAKPRHELLASGQELCVFKAPLAELLLAERGQAKVAWTWEA